MSGRTDMTRTSEPSAVRFLRDERGAISMEFVIWFPLLMFILLGCFVWFDAFRSSSQTSKVAYTVSDIVSRYESVDNARMADLFALQSKMLPPGVDRRALRITSICFAGGEHHVLWSQSANGADVEPMPEMTESDIPFALLPAMAEQESVILTEVRARWRPLTTYVGLGEKVWGSELVTRPRFTNIVPHADLNSATICPSGSV